MHTAILTEITASDMSKPLEIVTIGGSLSGLFASIPLIRLGHKVTILERSPTPLLHDQGAGIVAGGETQAFFAKHDALRRAIAVTSKERLYLNQDGQVIDNEGYEQRMTSWDLVYYLARANFDGLKSEYVNVGAASVDLKPFWARAKYEYGREVTTVSEKGDKVEVRWRNTREGSEESNGSGANEGTIECDYLIVADGPSSHIKGALLGDEASKRQYAGYVAFRGTVPEVQLSEEATKVFVEKFTFFHGDAIQSLAYTIPGQNGSLERGDRKVNWVWYWNVTESGEEYETIMTDSDGNKHRFTLPTGGKMSPHVWEKQKQRAVEHLPPQFAELVTKTEKPFVQAITDVTPPPRGTTITRLLGGKAVVIGDALSGFRPHTAASTSQAAFDALVLENAFEGRTEWEETERSMLNFAWSWQQRGVMLGERSQFGRHPLSHKSGGDSGQVSREELHMRPAASI